MTFCCVFLHSIVYVVKQTVVVEGVLKGYDKLDNLVLDDCIEYLRSPDDMYKITDQTRTIGLVVCKGTQIALIAPCDGMEEISNPFLEEEEEDAVVG